MEAVVRLEGAVSVVLDKLVERGYFQTRSEAIRAGVLELGREYCLMDPKEIEVELVARKTERIDAEIDAGKRKLVPWREAVKRANARK